MIHSEDVGIVINEEIKRIDENHFRNCYEISWLYSDLHLLAQAFGELSVILNDLGILNRDQFVKLENILESVKVDVPLRPDEDPEDIND